MRIENQGLHQSMSEACSILSCLLLSIEARDARRRWPITTPLIDIYSEYLKYQARKPLQRAARRSSPHTPNNPTVSAYMQLLHLTRHQDHALAPGHVRRQPPRRRPRCRGVSPGCSTGPPRGARLAGEGELRPPGALEEHERSDEALELPRLFFFFCSAGGGNVG